MFQLMFYKMFNEYSKIEGLKHLARDNVHNRTAVTRAEFIDVSFWSARMQFSIIL